MKCGCLRETSYTQLYSKHCILVASCAAIVRAQYLLHSAEFTVQNSQHRVDIEECAVMSRMHSIVQRITQHKVSSTM